jgi:hypothetical protein
MLKSFQVWPVACLASWLLWTFAMFLPFFMYFPCPSLGTTYFSNNLWFLLVGDDI